MIVKIRNKNEYGKKAYLKEVEVGKWFKFSIINVGQNMVAYGKVIKILNDDEVEVEKYFELPSYRPYAATSWFDKLPYAIAKNNN